MSLDYKKLFGPLTLTFLILFSFQAKNLRAGEAKVLGGVSLTSQGIPMLGLSVMGGYQADLFWGMQQETTIYLHTLTGSALKTKNGASGTVTVGMRSVEADWFALFTDVWGLDGIGPGIGYGIAETTETQTGSLDLTPFFTAKDVHYGVLLFKLQEQFGPFACEATANSFGGLIGGGVLCGFMF